MLHFVNCKVKMVIIGSCRICPMLSAFFYNSTGLFVSLPFKKIHNKYTIQRIMVVHMLIERETLQVFFTYFTDAQCVHFW